MTGKPYEAAVRAYITDCLRHRAQLDPAYHPTQDGAVKFIPHSGDPEEAERIRQTFSAVTSHPAADRTAPAASACPVPARPRRVLVTGSRTWTDQALIAAALREHWGDGAVLVSGACPHGADAIAERLWRGWGGQVERHPADWGTGRGAGMERNAAMVAAGADVCLAFIRDDSRGATHAAKLADLTGIPVRRYHHPRESKSKGEKALSGLTAEAAALAYIRQAGRCSCWDGPSVRSPTAPPAAPPGRAMTGPGAAA